MANFSINIDAQLLPVYTRTVQLRNYDLCSGAFDNTYSVALTEGTPTDLKLALLNTYTGPALKTLHITPSIINNPTAWWPAYNNNPLTVGVTTDIDITGLSITDTIPLLSFEMVTLIPFSNGIVLDIEITDINDVRYPAVASKFTMSVEECPAPADPILGDVGTVTPQIPCELGQTRVFSITAEPFSTVILRYTVEDSGNHGFGGALYETDPLDGVNVLYISGLIGTTGYTKDIIINIGKFGKKYFRACIEARPPIIPATNTCTVFLTLRNATNTGDLGTVILTDSETWA